jgi:hypothetical protein
VPAAWRGGCLRGRTDLKHVRVANVFSAEKIDAIFRANRRSQRDSKELLFSSVVRLLALAVCRVKSSVHAGYRDEQEKFQVSVNSVYGKLDKANRKSLRPWYVNLLRNSSPLSGS